MLARAAADDRRRGTAAQRSGDAAQTGACGTGADPGPYTGAGIGPTDTAGVGGVADGIDAWGARDPSTRGADTDPWPEAGS